MMMMVELKKCDYDNGRLKKRFFQLDQEKLNCLISTTPDKTISKWTDLWRSSYDFLDRIEPEQWKHRGKKKKSAALRHLIETDENKQNRSKVEKVII